MLAKLSEPAPTPPPAPSLLQQLGVTSLAEALTLAGTLKGLLAPAQSSDPMEAMVKAMGMIRTLRETADEINPPPPAGDPDNPISLIPSFLEVIKTGMQQQGGAAPTTIPTLALPNSVATAHDTVPQRLGDPAEVNNSEDEMQDIMNRALDMFARNETAEAVGNYLYEYLPDEAMSLLAQPNWLDMLLSFAPQFEPHRAKLIEAHKVIGARVAGAKRNG